MPSKSLFVIKETRRPFRHSRAKIVISGSSNEIKIIIFGLSYLTLTLLGPYVKKSHIKAFFTV